MDDNPDRRMFLDKLLSFMEEKGTPIVQCPTISKNPLDLYKLYIFAKEKGGYLEVSENIWRQSLSLHREAFEKNLMTKVLRRTKLILYLELRISVNYY